MLREITIKKYQKNELSVQKDHIIKEQRANIFVNGEHYISLMCLAQNLKELVVGFLFSEGVIGAYQDIAAIDAASADSINITVGNSPKNAQTGQRVMVSGFAQGSVNLPFFDYKNLQQLTGPLKLNPAEIIKMAASFNKQSELFKKTGAVHSCALLLPDGTNIFFEDIGRHNAIDKIIGQALIQDISVKDGILLTSGRISSEILIKAAKLGIPAIISISAPTSMAVELAQKINMTLIGFARGQGFNVYAGESRVVSEF